MQLNFLKILSTSFASSASLLIILSMSSAPLLAGVNSDFKERPIERFAIYTGDGNYKQAYHWIFNEDGDGPAVTIFLNHGSGGVWYDEIENEFGPCGPDYINESGDFAGTDYAGSCQVDENQDELFLADFNNEHVPIGPELNQFMLKKIVGSTQFAAWYWQDAFRSFDSPMHIFMVNRYDVVKDPVHLNNALYWLNVTDGNTVSRDTLPPYNFDGYGVSDINTEDRPIHSAPDISAFDNMFLYKAVKEQYPEVSLDNVIVEGRSNGGSAMIALAADYHIWTEQMREFWSRNLPAVDAPVEPEEDPVIVPSLTVADIINNPSLRAAFNTMLSGISENDLMSLLDNEQSLSLYSANVAVQGSAGEQPVVEEDIPLEPAQFSAQTFPQQLASYIHGDFYQAVKLVHAFYPGCSLNGLMDKDLGLAPGQIDADGDNVNGYQVALKMMLSFGDDDSLYTETCDARVSEAANNIELAGEFKASAIVDGNVAVIGEVFDPAEHGFDYKNVYKNAVDRSASDQDKAAESRRAIERVLNQSLLELNLPGVYQLPVDLELE